MSSSRLFEKGHLLRSRSSPSLRRTDVRLGRAWPCGLGSNPFETGSILLRFLVMLVVVLVTAACNLKLNEESPKKPENLDFKLGFETKCLSGALPVVADFFEGTAQPQAVAETWDCFSGAIQLFEFKTHGVEKDRYKPQELAKFFEDYFFKEGTKLSPEFLSELMRLKQILIGGDRDYVTHAELKKLVEFANEAKGVSLDLLPYMKIYSFHWSVSDIAARETDLDTFDQANAQLQKAVEILGARINSNQREYEIDHLVTFLEEVEKLYQQEWKMIADLKRISPLIKKLKKTLVGGQEQVVQANEWQNFGRLAARGYVQYLRFYYFIDKAPHPGGRWDLVALTRAVDDLFSFLGDMVAVKPQGILTREEIGEVVDSFQAFLDGDWVISPVLIDEIMRFKAALAGGTETEFRPEEFQKLRQHVTALDSYTSALYPALDFYLLSWKPADQRDPHHDLDNAEFALSQFAEKAGSLFQNDYDLQSLISLVHELGKTFPKGEGRIDWEDLANRFGPVIVAGSEIVTGESGSVVSKDKLPVLLGTVGQIYGKYLNYHYFVEPAPDWMKGAGLNEIASLVNDSADLINGILVRRDAQTVPFVELQGLVNSLVQSKVLPDWLKESVTAPLIEVLFRKILLNPELRLAGELPNGWTPEATRVIKQEFQSWVDGQIFAQNLFKDGETRLTPGEVLSRLDAQAQTRLLHELRMSFVSPMPLSLDKEGRLFMSPKESRSYDWDSIARVNLGRVLVRIINNGYINDVSRLQSDAGFNKDEANALYLDLKPVAVEAGLVEASDTAFANDRFRDANLFMAHSDGSTLVSFAEGVDLVEMILSGLALDSGIKKYIEKGQCPSLEIDGAKAVPLRCFLSSYRKNLAKVFTSMPEFTARALVMKSNLSKNGQGPLTEQETGPFEKMMLDFLKATGWKDDGSGNVKLSALSLVPHVIQYTEVLLVKYDKDKNGFIDRVEALRAFPLFHDTLKLVAPEGLNSDEILEGAFAYVLVNGHLPLTIGDQLKFLGLWIPQRDTWPVWAPRQQIGKVLAYIAELTSQPASAPAPAVAPTPTPAPALGSAGDDSTPPSVPDDDFDFGLDVVL